MNKRQLAALTMQSGDTSSAQAIVSSLSTEEDLAQGRDSAALQALLESRNPQSLEEGRALRLAQRAVILAPWKESNWRALAHVRTQMPGVTG